MSSLMIALSCHDVGFAYAPSKPVLRDVTFEVESGQICGLVGASGSGKSTLLRILAGILPAGQQHVLSGKVEVDGRMPAYVRSAGRIGFVFQDAKILPFLTVRENIFWATKGNPLLGNEQETNCEVSRVLDLVGLSNCADQWPKSLSGGMKARVALGRAIVNRPSHIFLDEAFASLDVGWRLVLYQELQRLRDELALTIMMISHDLEDIAEIADSVIVLSSSGSVVGEIGAGASVKSKVEQMRLLVLADHAALGKAL